MALSFNTAGPCVPGEHYMLPPVRRLGPVMELIDEKKFLMLHAGHQTGKTTCARWLVEQYNHEGRFACAWVDLEEAREQPDLAIATDGGLGLPRLMTAAGFSYKEAGPHLMLMAFLQRIINGGGRIEREYGLGRGALDLMICWQSERHAIEVKLRRDTETQGSALEHTAGYLDRAGLDEGWLVMFDLRKRRSWKEKLFTKVKKVRGKRVHLVGC